MTSPFSVKNFSDEKEKLGANVIQYETFESSSGGEEAQQCIFESEALSF